MWLIAWFWGFGGWFVVVGLWNEIGVFVGTLLYDTVQGFGYYGRIK